MVFFFIYRSVVRVIVVSAYFVAFKCLEKSSLCYGYFLNCCRPNAFICFIVVLLASAGICSSPLGLEDGSIRYGQLTSSSHRENNPADAGRLNIIPNV